jgi:hypothetical protein
VTGCCSAVSSSHNCKTPSYALNKTTAPKAEKIQHGEKFYLKLMMMSEYSFKQLLAKIYSDFNTTNAKACPKQAASVV